MAQQTVASVARNRLPYSSVRAYPRHRLPAAPGRRRTTCAAAFCKLHVCTSRSLLWPAGPSWLLPRSQVPSAVTQLLLENASLIIFSTYSPPQALQDARSFSRGGAQKKRSLVSRKSVKSCARPPPPRKAQPRRAALTLRLAVASRSACRPSIGMPPPSKASVIDMC